MTRFRGTAPVVALLLVILLPSISEASAASVTGSSLLSSSESAIARQHSVHVVSITSNDILGATPGVKATVNITTDAATSEGTQHVTYQQGATSGHEMVEVINGVGYFRGDEFILQNFNGFSASAAARYADMWLEVTKSDGAFAKVTSGVTMSTMAEQISMPHPKLLTGVSIVRGVSVRRLRATITSGGGGGAVTTVLCIRSRGIPLPVEQTFVQKGEGNGSDIFSHWNEPVAVSAPTSSIPFATTGQ